MHFDVAVIGSGMAGLSAAALLSQKGLKVAVIEQNYLPGGCTSSYWRKGFVFESGATTLVGLDKGMPLAYLLEKTGVELPVRKLALPMRLLLHDGQVVDRKEDLEEWITEAEKVFGASGQRQFWSLCYDISKFVWNASTRFMPFPPSTAGDLAAIVHRARPSDVKYARWSLFSVASLLKKFGLHENRLFVDFVNEQLMITAQNTADNVNVLFGATSLCYTNYGNYYVEGGMINLVSPLMSYIEKRGGEVFLRHAVEQVRTEADVYQIFSKQQNFSCRYLIGAIPANNMVQLLAGSVDVSRRVKLMDSSRLNSAFQVGIGFVPHRNWDTLHHQVYLAKPLAGIGSRCFFLSVSHPEDTSRSDEPGMMVASVSTHVPDPANTVVDGTKLQEALLAELDARDLIKKKNIVYCHHSGPKAWEKWTGRKWGFVGGYPQQMRIKPWQMGGARLDGKRAYLCGDTVYPGQGIPGVVLSGVMAAETLARDWL